VAYTFRPAAKLVPASIAAVCSGLKLTPTLMPHWD
jgi:hypothetical protein